VQSKEKTIARTHPNIQPILLIQTKLPRDPNRDVTLIDVPERVKRRVILVASLHVVQTRRSLVARFRVNLKLILTAHDARTEPRRTVKDDGETPRVLSTRRRRPASGV